MCGYSWMGVSESVPVTELSWSSGSSRHREQGRDTRAQSPQGSTWLMDLPAPWAFLWQFTVTTTSSSSSPEPWRSSWRVFRGSVKRHHLGFYMQMGLVKGDTRSALTEIATGEGVACSQQGPSNCFRPQHGASNCSKPQHSPSTLLQGLLSTKPRPGRMHNGSKQMQNPQTPHFTSSHRQDREPGGGWTHRQTHSKKRVNRRE